MLVSLKYWAAVPLQLLAHSKLTPNFPPIFKRKWKSEGRSMDKFVMEHFEKWSLGHLSWRHCRNQNLVFTKPWFPNRFYPNTSTFTTPNPKQPEHQNLLIVQSVFSDYWALLITSYSTLQDTLLVSCYSQSVPRLGTWGSFYSCVIGHAF